VVVDLNPTHDCKHARRLLAQAQAGPPPARLYPDSGYDAEWIHEHCREEWGVESLIQPVVRRTDGTLEPVMNFIGEKYVQGKYILGISLEWRRNEKDIRVM